MKRWFSRGDVLAVAIGAALISTVGFLPVANANVSVVCGLLLRDPPSLHVPIVVKDLGSAPTGPYDQLVNVPTSLYSPSINLDFSNVYFTGSDGSCVPSWIESNATSTAVETHVWLSIQNVPAHSAITVYMDVASPFVNVLSSTGPAGEAPELSPTYGAFDNGASIFQSYWNFESVPAGWNVTTSGSGNVTVHDGATIRGSIAELSSGSPEWNASVSIDYLGTLGFATSSSAFGATMGAVTAFDDTGWGTTSGCSSVREFYNIQEYPAGGACNHTVAIVGQTGVYTFDWPSPGVSDLRFDYSAPFDSVHLGTATTFSSPGFQVVYGPWAEVTWLRARPYVAGPVLVSMADPALPCSTPRIGISPDGCV